jgi:hypothetical protein
MVNSSAAARLFAGLIAAAVFFQLGLAAGLPWGELAWGGAFPGALPARMRVASLAAVAILALLALIVLARAGLVLPGWRPASRKLVWGVVAYCALGAVANALTPSAWERLLWLPVNIFLLWTSVAVARGG